MDLHHGVLAEKPVRRMHSEGAEGHMAEDPRKPIRDPKGESDAPVKEPPPQKPPVEEPEKVEDDLNEDDRFQGTDN
jgi:hypothetical protein